MAQLEDHVIRTGPDGTIVGTAADVDDLVNRLVGKHRIVLHFHGGLISDSRGEQIAARLLPVYESADAYPVFFVWRSGLLEILIGNLVEIVDDALFKNLRMKVAKWTDGKRRHTGGAKAGTVAAVNPHEIDVWRELSKLDAEREPYELAVIPDDFDELSPEEEAEFIAELQASPALKAATLEVVESALDEPAETEVDHVPSRVAAAASSLVSPEIVEELKVEAAKGEGEKGALELLSIAKKAALVLTRTIHRLRIGRDHGIYPTIVEEILREFYLANVGSAVWAAMKGETADTFADVAGRGGRRFMATLGKRMADTGWRPEITLVGHSTGAVFINNLLRHLRQARDDPDHPMPDDVRIRNVVFLAPACTYEHMAGALDEYGSMVDRFRMYTMSDDAESDNSLLPAVYTRSLLYFISGVLERTLDGGSDFDAAVVGMQRYFLNDDDVYTTAELDVVRDFLAGREGRTVWSPTMGGPGLSSGALEHTTFDDDEATLESVGPSSGQDRERASLRGRRRHRWLPRAESGQPGVGAGRCAGLHRVVARPRWRRPPGGQRHLRAVARSGGGRLRRCRTDEGRSRSCFAPAPPQDTEGDGGRSTRLGRQPPLLLCVGSRHRADGGRVCPPACRLQRHRGCGEQPRVLRVPQVVRGVRPVP
ncbi:MAG: alpha/beta hydrolase [bacterium]|nr:alpha/beta hydrolase [bacterium]